MIFTRRFGALAARPVFRDMTETAEEAAPELETQNAEAGRMAEESVA